MKHLIKKILPEKLFETIEPLGHKLEAEFYSLKYRRPAKNMRVIGVTGTNGKTTTSFMIFEMLRKAGYNVGLMTTVAYGVNDDIKQQIAHMTSVSSPLLNKRLAEFKIQGAKWLVLEVTSHALAQHRIAGVPIEIAVMTNVTHEHLDYHKTFDRYQAAKKRLFSIAGKNPKGYAVVNADDSSADSYLKATGKGISYGINSGQIKACDIKLGSEGSDYLANIGDDKYRIHCNIPGEFNVANSLATIAVGRKLGLSKTQIEQGIDGLKSVEGRMNNIKAGQQYSLIIDFAHTPDSFERLLGDMRRATVGKLIVMFGSAGRRDESKRAIQGKIAGKYADEVIVTEEDDRDVDGNLILDQIAKGAEESGKVRDSNLFLILDRVKAIEFAVSRPKTSQDTVVLLGKGHEKSIERADGEHPWNEAEQAIKAIKSSQARD